MRLVDLLVLGLLSALSWGQDAPVQPIPFSHKTHSGFQLSCKFCHTGPEPGNLMTLPAAQTCMGCHSAVATGKPAIQTLAAFAKSGEPIPWKPVYSVPGFVYWSHRTHLEAGMTCEMCHGNVAQMETMSRVTNVTTMAGCVACHRKKEAPTGCETCHESQSSLLHEQRHSFKTADLSTPLRSRRLTYLSFCQWERESFAPSHRSIRK